MVAAWNSRPREQKIEGDKTVHPEGRNWGFCLGEFGGGNLQRRQGKPRGMNLQYLRKEKKSAYHSKGRNPW